MTANYNTELKGIELSFNSKPSDTILNLLRETGYRWHNVKKIWYAKQNEKTIKAAQQIEQSEGKTITDISKTITEKPSYYPAYESIGEIPIYKSSEIEIIDHTRINNYSGYFSDINAYIHIYFGQVKIIDLTNALTTGKTCKSISVNMSTNNDDIRCLCSNKYKTFKNMYVELFVNKNYEGYTVYNSEDKAINIFTPFKEIHAIKKPEKWTTAHIWKAILSGQIYKGIKDGYYSDDYAQDNAEGFRTGRKLSLIKMAQSLIESPSGWWVSVDKSEGNTAVLSFNCHSFDSNTLYFDESCNYEEAQHRAEEDETERENYNKSMLAQVKNIKIEDIQRESVYTIQYLDMNDNTKKYEIKVENIQGSQIFYTDTVYLTSGEEYEETESRYKIIAIEKVQINNSEIYEVSNFYDRPYYEKDKRIIDLGNWQNIITGKALKELMQEGYSFPCIKESRQTAGQIIKDIEAHITGRKQWLFVKNETNYIESLNRFNNEILRAANI